MKNINYLKELSQNIRLRILELAYGVGKNGSHVGGALSSSDILSTLYGSILKYDLNDPLNPNRDRFILSKGHAAIALYATLEKIGYLTKDEVNLFEVNGSPFYAHASRNIMKGIEFSGGSLSLGLSFGVGVAIACKKEGLNNQIYVLLGDGECDEGLVWEAAMSASHYKLDNLTVIVDCNGLQSDGLSADVMTKAPLADKFSAFGFNTTDINGHDISMLYNSLQQKKHAKPNAIVAHTVKGKGVSFMENNKNWHHGVLTLNEYAQALAELNNLVL